MIRIQPCLFADNYIVYSGFCVAMADHMATGPTIFTYYLAHSGKSLPVSDLSPRIPELLCENPTHELHRIFQSLPGQTKSSEKLSVLKRDVKCKQLTAWVRTWTFGEADTLERFPFTGEVGTNSIEVNLSRQAAVPAPMCVTLKKPLALRPPVLCKADFLRIRN